MALYGIIQSHVIFLITIATKKRRNTMASDLTTWINSFRDKQLLYGSEDAARVANIDVKIGSLFSKYVVNKTRFTLRIKVYVVIAMETNANIIICVHPTQTSGYLHPCKWHYRMQPSYHYSYVSREQRPCKSRIITSNII